MDAFFASVEQRDFPALQGKPIAVGGGGRRGVVASASYEARKFGVRSAMPGFKAIALCPQLQFVRHRFEVYKEVSNQIRDIFLSHTDLVEPLSLDEAYLDVTDHKLGMDDAFEIAEDIRHAIFETTQLTASAGVSFNKFLAKIASDINKPNGIKVITRAEAGQFLEALPIQKFHGIGKVTAAKMQAMGIHTGKHLKAADELTLIRRFGKSGRYYYRMVRAQDDRAVNPSRIRKSVGAERTFSENLTELADMVEKTDSLSDRIFQYMDKTQNFGRTVTLKIKTDDFKLITRSKTFPREIRHLESLQQVARDLLQENHSGLRPVRLLGVAVSNLEKDTNGEGVQLRFDF